MIFNDGRYPLPFRVFHDHGTLSVIIADRVP